MIHPILKRTLTDVLISIEKVIGMSPLLTSVWFTPWCASGVVLAAMSGLLLHLVSGWLLLIISCIASVIAIILFALMPESPNYWAWVFPAMLAQACCVDILFTVSNVYLSTSMPRKAQGIAGALINFTVFIASAAFLALENVAVSQFKNQGWDLKTQYHGVFWIGVGIATAGTLLSLFIKIDKATSMLTPEEKELAAKTEVVSTSEECLTGLGIFPPPPTHSTLNMMQNGSSTTVFDDSHGLGMGRKMSDGSSSSSVSVPAADTDDTISVGSADTAVTVTVENHKKDLD